jgi:hypothetical protein
MDFTCRPIWLQSVIHLIEPHLIPVTKELLCLIEAGKAWTLGQIGIAMKEVISCTHDIVEIIPVPVLRLCLEIESRLPSSVKPLAGSALVQMIICGLYR